MVCSVELSPTRQQPLWSMVWTLVSRWYINRQRVLEDNVKVVINSSAVTEVIMVETARTAVPMAVTRIVPVALAVVVVTPVVTVNVVTRVNSRQRTSQWINLKSNPEVVMETMVNETTRIGLEAVVVVRTEGVVVVISPQP